MLKLFLAAYYCSVFQLCCLLFKFFDLPFSTLASFLTSYETGKIIFHLVKVKYAHEPSCPTYWNLSQFAKHEATRTTRTTPRGWDALNLLLTIYTAGRRKML